MRRLAFFVALTAYTIIAQPSFARDCTTDSAEDRWGIKTSVPDGVLDLTPKKISLQSLMDVANPAISKAQKAALKDRRWAGRVQLSDSDGNGVSLKEGDMITAEGFLYRIGCKTDGDFHLEVGTADNPRAPHCWIVEVPDPNEIKGNKDLKSNIVEVRKVLDGLPNGIFSSKANAPPVRVTITGQLFLDAHHLGGKDPSGRRGRGFCATNIWEIHPVTGLTVH